MKWKSAAAIGLAAIMCVTAAGCGSNGGGSSAKKEGTSEGAEQVGEADQESDKLVINYVSARGNGCSPECDQKDRGHV